MERACALLLYKAPNLEETNFQRFYFPEKKMSFQILIIFDFGEGCSSDLRAHLRRFPHENRSFLQDGPVTRHFKAQKPCGNATKRKRNSSTFQNFLNYQNRFSIEKVTSNHVSDFHDEKCYPFGNASITVLMVCTHTSKIITVSKG